MLTLSMHSADYAHGACARRNILCNKCIPWCKATHHVLKLTRILQDAGHSHIAPRWCSHT